MGRKTQLTPDLHGVIVRALKQGMTREDTAGLAGITSRSLRNWVSRGEFAMERIEDALELEESSGVPYEPSEEDVADEIYCQFAIDVREAEATVVNALTGSVLKAALGTPGDPEKGIAPTPGDWRAAIAYLERRHNAWKQKSQLDLAGDTVAATPKNAAILVQEEFGKHGAISDEADDTDAS